MISFSANSIEKKTITVLRDSEIEFFIQHLINEMLILHKKEKDSVKPRILLNNEINAFVVEKKNIYINSGLIQNASSIEEIQGVLAHELGHLFLGHIQSRKAYRNRNSYHLAIAFFTLLGASLASNSDLTGLILVGQDLTLKSKYKYNRNQEMEADIFAIKSLNNLNINTIGLRDFFRKVKKKQQILINNVNSYYISHPSPQNRLEIIKDLSKPNVNVISNKINFGKFNIELDQIKIKIDAFSKNKKNLNYKNYNNIFLKNYQNLAINYLNGNLNKALNYTKTIKNFNPSNPFIFELLGDLYFERNEIDKSTKNYNKAIKLLEKFNIKSNSLIKLSLVKALIKKNNKKSLIEAFKVLEEIIPFEAQTTLLWRLIAKTAGKLNKISIAYIALAEEQLIKKNIKKAKQYASLGLKDKKLSVLYKIRGDDILNLNN